MTLKYTPDHLDWVCSLITARLTPDLLVRTHRERNKEFPLFGHCHHASACLHLIFGKNFLELYRAQDDEGIWHWWVQDNDGNIIDLSASQDTDRNLQAPYDRGRRHSIMGWRDGGPKKGVWGYSYAKRVKILYDSVLLAIQSQEKTHRS